METLLESVDEFTGRVGVHSRVYRSTCKLRYEAEVIKTLRSQT